MSHEELQAYLQAQLEEIRAYRDEQNAVGGRQIDLHQAIDEWIERYGASYHDRWLHERHEAGAPARA